MRTVHAHADDLEAPTQFGTSAGSGATRVLTRSATVRPSSLEEDSIQPTTRNDPPPPPAAVGRRGSGARVASETRRRSSLLEQLRGASAQLLGVADAKPEDDEDGAKPSLEREFKRLVKRLVKEDARELPAVQAAVQAWQREKFDSASERQQLRMYRELLGDVLPPFLVGHVKKATRAMIWDAVLTIRTVMLTWGDTSGLLRSAAAAGGLEPRHDHARSAHSTWRRSHAVCSTEGCAHGRCPVRRSWRASTSSSATRTTRAPAGLIR